MKMVSKVIACALVAFGSSPVWAEETISEVLREAILYERDSYQHQSVTKFSVAINDTLLPDSFYSQGSNLLDNLFGDHYDLMYRFNFAEPGSIASLPNAAGVSIMIGDRAQIEAFKRLERVKVLPRAESVLELGESIVGDLKYLDGTDLPERYLAGKLAHTTTFRARIFAPICTSLFVDKHFGPKTYKKDKPRRPLKYAYFIIERKAGAELCLRSLFLDLLGLRGLAVRPSASKAEVDAMIEELKSLENLTVISR